MTFMRVMVVIVVLDLIILYWAKDRIQLLHNDEIMVSALIRID